MRAASPMKAMKARAIVRAAAFACVGLAMAVPATAQRTPQTGAPANWPLPIHDNRVFTFVQVDRLEGQTLGPEGGYLWDAQGWIGTDLNKFWGKLRGGGLRGGKLQDAEIQALYGRTISPFFDLQAGVRQDVTPDASRTYGVLGVEGLAPYRFELDSAVFFSNKGEVTARFEAEYELLCTERLILQPRVELNAAFQDVSALRIGSGLSSTEFGLRLRYEIRRQFGPYVGVSWDRAFGHTADFVRAAGSDTGTMTWVAGVRFWH